MKKSLKIILIVSSLILSNIVSFYSGYFLTKTIVNNNIIGHPEIIFSANSTSSFTGDCKSGLIYFHLTNRGSDGFATVVLLLNGTNVWSQDFFVSSGSTVFINETLDTNFLLDSDFCKPIPPPPGPIIYAWCNTTQSLVPIYQATAGLLYPAILFVWKIEISNIYGNNNLGLRFNG